MGMKIVALFSSNSPLAYSLFSFPLMSAPLMGNSYKKRLLRGKLIKFITGNLGNKVQMVLL